MSKLATHMALELSDREHVRTMRFVELEKKTEPIRIGSDHFFYTLTATFSAQVGWSTSPKTSRHDTGPEVAQRMILREVFGEYEMPLCEAISQCNAGDTEACARILNQILHNMFEIGEMPQP